MSDVMHDSVWVSVIWRRHVLVQQQNKWAKWSHLIVWLKYTLKTLEKLWKHNWNYLTFHFDCYCWTFHAIWLNVLEIFLVEEYCTFFRKSIKTYHMVDIYHTYIYMYVCTINRYTYICSSKSKITYIHTFEIKFFAVL